jgi:hypothetical protein
MEMDWSDKDPQVRRDNAILRAQIRDARNDVVRWRELARSNEELFYLDEMYESLGVLAGIVDARLTGSDPNDEERKWETRANLLLDAYVRASKLRRGAG